MHIVQCLCIIINFTHLIGNKINVSHKVQRKFNFLTVNFWPVKLKFNYVIVSKTMNRVFMVKLERLMLLIL